ncbi:MAG: hypothetical protein ACM3S5_08140 [Rhodospirillales bacterium]
MARWGILLCAAALAAAQQTAPVGIVRGTLIDRDDAQAGEMIVRLKDNHVYNFQFDAKTYVEKDKRSVPMTALQAGDTLEILSDTGSDPHRRYARTVKVVEEDPPTPPYRVRLRRQPQPQRSIVDELFPRGNLTFAGIVVSVGRDSLLLRTRQTRTRFVLRPDTRYLCDGLPVEAGGLAVNTRVFVRAGRNVYNELEAFQVIWGDILKPN